MVSFLATICLTFLALCANFRVDRVSSNASELGEMLQMITTLVFDSRAVRSTLVNLLSLNGMGDELFLSLSLIITVPRVSRLYLYVTLLMNFISCVRSVPTPIACAEAPSLPARSIKLRVPLVRLMTAWSLVLDSIFRRKLHRPYMECDLELFRLKLVVATWRIGVPQCQERVDLVHGGALFLAEADNLESLVLVLAQSEVRLVRVQ